jgi:hypothetical protein
MTRRLGLGLALFGALAACEATVGGDGAAHSTARQTVTAPVPEKVAPAPVGSCTAREIVPAEYRYVMGQVQVVQAERAQDGSIINPPVYRQQPVPKLVKPREEITFPAPCPAQMTPDFIATVQRALFARGYYAGRINAGMDPATREAILRYQRRQGLNSAQLSLEAARALGVSAVDIAPDEAPQDQ